MEINTTNSTQSYSSSLKAGTEALNSTTAPSTSRPSINLLGKQKFDLSISEEAVVRAVERANKAIIGNPKHVEFSIHKPHGDIIIKIVNTETNEVVHEIPAEKILNLLDVLVEISGKIIDEKR